MLKRAQQTPTPWQYVTENTDPSPALCRRLRSRLYTVVWGEEKAVLAAEVAPSTAVPCRAAEEYEQEEEEQVLEEV